MYIFLFWPFRVFGFIISLFALAKLGQIFFPSLLSSTFGSILLVFAIPLVALFWIDFHKFYFKFVSPENENKKIRKSKKRKKNIHQENIFTNLLKGFFGIIEFFLGLINPWLLAIIIITILIGLISSGNK
tara:strand:- start:743 stop:1132 length:390 start_codon:yes stop_codon:yes gene_type:complete